MKITFSNIGKIKRTELDLKPLTVIIGPNNSNKTYLAYSIYALWHQAGSGWSHTHATRPSEINIPTPTDWQVKKLNEGSYEIALNDDFFAFFKNVGQQIANSLDTKALREFFQDTNGKLFNKAKIEISVEKDDLRLPLERLNWYTFVFELEPEGPGFYINFSINKDVLSVQIEAALIEDQTQIIGDPESKGKKKSPQAERMPDILNILSFIARRLLKFLFFDSLALPAERTALVTAYKPLLVNRFTALRTLRRRAIGASRKQEKLFEFDEDAKETRADVRFAQPVEDFLDFMVRSERWQPLSHRHRTKFTDLANLMESSIHGESKVVLHKRGEGTDIRIETAGIQMDLWNASSSIKQLVPLTLYMRYLAEDGDFLIIDEPEMNLHPTGQAQLLEVLAALVTAGVRILITTHSPYIMTHLNTLISGKVGDSGLLKKQAQHLYLQESSSFLSPDDVSAYEMRDNKLVSLKDDDYGIRWDTLGDVSADLRDKYLDIME